MKTRNLIATVTLAALPFFAVAAVQNSDPHQPQPIAEQASGSGMAGHSMNRAMKTPQSKNAVTQARDHMSDWMEGMTAWMTSHHSMMSSRSMSHSDWSCPMWQRDGK